MEIIKDGDLQRALASHWTSQDCHGGRHGVERKWVHLLLHKRLCASVFMGKISDQQVKHFTEVIVRHIFGCFLFWVDEKRHIQRSVGIALRWLNTSRFCVHQGLHARF
jgi:hypothetical protein